jgi:cytochrome o ubiquinol oxidase subunit 3
MTHSKGGHHDITSNTIFGFWAYLMTDCVMFATFFATYAVLRTGTFGGPTAKELFDLSFALKETLVLLTSSFTCAIATLFAQRETKGQALFFYFVTFVLGALFMVMEWLEFQGMFDRGLSWQSNAFMSAYFTLIGVHGLHIIGGLLVLVIFAMQLILWGLTEVVMRRLTCLRMYWHFLYLIWAFTFAIVYMIGVQ